VTGRSHGLPVTCVACDFCTGSPLRLFQYCMRKLNLTSRRCFLRWIKKPAFHSKNYSVPRVCVLVKANTRAWSTEEKYTGIYSVLTKNLNIHYHDEMSRAFRLTLFHGKVNSIHFRGHVFSLSLACKSMKTRSRDKKEVKKSPITKQTNSLQMALRVLVAFFSALNAGYMLSSIISCLTLVERFPALGTGRLHFSRS